VDDRFASLRAATAAALLRGSGATPVEVREAVARATPPADLATLVQKIRAHAYKVTDLDIDGLRNRYTEDQLFEILVAAAFGAAEDRLAAGRRALEDA
jgi:alkylhydroperoxidase/carboxymuconolactone decarboxylase family protein YurZ